ncbi:universal stress protein [uncultured Dokdonia sp.]|uniref:universal stress protein n=1 Tax=Dokdonia sp. R78006 TaxID=3093866 RepID=UPI00262491CD|nr:universal stress protein [uncultured Dokdonia sp.]
MAHILVPTDFSENAYNALFYATRLYPNEECIITLVHSFESLFSTNTSRIDIGRNEQLYDELERAAFDKLDTLKHEITLDSEGISLVIDMVTSAQPLYKIVNKLIINTNIDVVVMGTKGSSGMREIFLGSQTVKLIKKIKPVPVFVVPQSATFQAPTKVAYATDLKIDYAQYPLEIIKEIIRTHKSKLYITHIYNQMSPGQTVETNYRKLKHKLEDVSYTTHWLSSITKMEDALGVFINEHDINLLVLMYHKNGFLKKLFNKSFVDKLSFHSEIPLLILPESF